MEGEEANVLEKHTWIVVFFVLNPTLLYFHELGPLSYFRLELTSETMNPFIDILVGLLGRGDRSIARPVPTQDNSTVENMDVCVHHAWCGIRTHDPSIEQSKVIRALDREAAPVCFTPCVVQNPSNFL